MINNLKRRFSKDTLLKDGALLMSAALISHVCNILFQMFMGRTLPGFEYALLCTLLGFANIASLPLSAMNTAVNHSASLMVRDGREGDISKLIRKWLIRVGSIGGLILIVCLVFPDAIAEFLHLDRKAPVIVMGLVFCMVFCSSVVGGATNGLQMFGVASIGLQVSAILRLLAGIAFVLCFAKAAGWGLLGHAVGLAANLCIVFGFLWHRLHGLPKSGQAVPSIGRYAIQSFVILMAFAVLLRADMILVKHFLPEEATVFAYATTIGHIVIFLPMPLARAMFPKVATEGVGTERHREVLTKSLLYTGVFILPAAVGCSLFGWIPLRVLYGIREPSNMLLQLVSAMGWVMFPMALINIVTYFNLAQRRFLRLVPVLVMAIVYIVGAALFHDTVWQIVGVAAVSTWGCLATLLWMLFHRPWRS